MWTVLLLFLAIKTCVSIFFMIFLYFFSYCPLFVSSAILFTLFLWVSQFAADLAIQLPASNSLSFSSSPQQAYFRLDYQPPYGHPPANTTIAAQDIGNSKLPNTYINRKSKLFF